MILTIIIIMDNSKSLKRLLVALFIIIILIGSPIIFFKWKKAAYTLPVEVFNTELNITQSDPVQEQIDKQTDKQDDPFKTSTLPERYIIDHHTVVKNESFSLITGKYWQDLYLWPDLYIKNEMRSEDPDIIYPKEVIDIYNRLGKGDQYDDIDKDQILKAYIEVYNIYKKLGPEKDNSVWALLYSGAKYDHNFLELFSDRIDPVDKAMAQKYIDEEGYLD